MERKLLPRNVKHTISTLYNAQENTSYLELKKRKVLTADLAQPHMLSLEIEHRQLGILRDPKELHRNVDNREG